jgi:pyruvate/2-oxoglutarate dehydrogenase complex dihydrolipoamide dehydrogenase (E3) component
MIASNTVINNNDIMIKNRPDIKVSGVNNLYSIGDWVGPYGMLVDTSFASAKAVALKILNEKE